jgi:CRP-like cAMP-binding protein
MATYLIRKLEQFTKLSSDDKQALEQAASLHVRQLRPREDIIHEGDKPRHVNLILEGWACRYKVLEDGRRQVTAFLVPGDMCDLRMFILKEMDHSMAAVTPLKVAEIPSDTILEITDKHPRISRALWWNSLVEEATAREWTVNLGQREAVERLSHILCEMYLRLRGVGLTNGSAEGPSFEVPVTQEQLGDTVGLSTVHVNRTLQDELRAKGLIELTKGELRVLDWEGLKRMGEFDPTYLHHVPREAA